MLLRNTGTCKYLYASPEQQVPFEQAPLACKQAHVGVQTRIDHFALRRLRAWLKGEPSRRLVRTVSYGSSVVYPLRFMAQARKIFIVSVRCLVERLQISEAREIKQNKSHRNRRYGR